jgi:small redox-active disulfide protein 2
MSIFTFGKKPAQPCSCGADCDAESLKAAKLSLAGGSRVKVLGSGCAKCRALEAAVREALAELGLAVEIEHVSDFAKIAAYGVMTTPALVVDGKVVSFGKVLKADEVKALLGAALK